MNDKTMWGRKKDKMKDKKTENLGTEFINLCRLEGLHPFEK